MDLRSLVLALGWSEVEMQPVSAPLGFTGGPPHVTFGPPCGERIAVSWS